MTNFARLVNWKIVRRLDNWKFWVLIAYIGLAVFAVFLWAQNRQTSADEARTEKISAQRHSDLVANADSQYQQCVKSIPILQEFDTFVRGVREVHSVLVRNAIASHAATPPGTPFYRAQARNLKRLEDGLNDVKPLTLPTPTRKQCRRLRARLLKQ